MVLTKVRLTSTADHQATNHGQEQFVHAAPCSYVAYNYYIPVIRVPSSYDPFAYVVYTYIIYIYILIAMTIETLCVPKQVLDQCMTQNLDLYMVGIHKPNRSLSRMAYKI